MTEQVVLCCGEPVGPTGFCDVCGRKQLPVETATVVEGGHAATEVMSTAGGSTTRTGRRISDGEPGGAVEFALLPPIEPPDVTSRLLTDPHYPEVGQFCGNPACHRPVGRSHAGQPALTEGFCGSCGLPFNFAPKLRPGDRMADRYDILGWLAHGGLGWVYLAQDQALKGLVAIKGVINPTDANARELASVERDVLIRLEHPNIVRIGDFVSHPNPSGGKPDDYIVMDYVHGMTLQEIIESPVELRIEHIVVYGRAILAALSHLHGEGLLYCDMKPRNVIHGVKAIKVVDLGAARAMEDRKSKPVGTRGFTVGSPEIAKHGLTVRSDVYTVGKTLDRLFEASLDAHDDSVGVQSFKRLVARAVSGFHERFETAGEMSEQLDGVRREILSLRDRKPRPAPSARFDSTPELLDSGLGSIPGLDRWTAREAETALDVGLPFPVEAASRLPVPWSVADEATTLFLETAGSTSPRRLLDKLRTHDTESVDVEFSRFRAYVELGDLDGAVGAIGRAEQLLGDKVSTDWRVRWYHGVLALARGNVVRAAVVFDGVYSILPGEDAPKLALGFCYEHSGPGMEEQSRRCYEAVWLRDNSQASAAFGLARLRLRGILPDGRRAPDRRKEAVEILDQVPHVSRHFDVARIAAVRICAAHLESGPPGVEDLVEAARRLPDLYLDGGDDEGESRDRMTAVVQESALRRVLAGGDEPAWSGGEVLGDPVTERGLRLLIERSFRRLADRARNEEEHGILVDRANSVRPKTFT
jgi:serine/threonine-protein kinase PknG